MMVKFVVQPYHVCAVPVGKVFNRSRVVYGGAAPDFVGWGFLAEHRIILISRFQGDRVSEIGENDRTMYCDIRTSYLDWYDGLETVLGGAR